MPHWSSEADLLRDDVIETFGRSVTLTFKQPIFGAFVPATGTRSGSSTLTVTVNAVRSQVFQGLVPGGEGGSAATEGSRYTVSVADLTAALAALVIGSTVIPREGWTVTDAGTVHSVTGVGRSLDGKFWELTTQDTRQAAG